MKRLIMLVSAVLVLGSLSALQAQNSTSLALTIAQARKANAAVMQQYNWNSRTELIDNGKVADIRIDLVNYGPNGKIQRSLLNDEGSPMPKGFLRKKIAEDKKEKVEKYLKGLQALLDEYTLPTAGKILDFVSQGTVIPPDAAGCLQIAGNNVITPGDSLSIWVDAKTFQTRHMTISTTFEGDPVSVTAYFKVLAGSKVCYMNFADVEIPAKNYDLQVQNYDYVQN